MPKLATPLTDTRLRNAKPKDKPYVLADGHNLYVEVAPLGTKTWRMYYRRPNSGKPNRLTFGRYPIMTLLEARQRCAEARKLLAEGIDPGEEKKRLHAARTRAAANSFQVISEEWCQKKIAHLSAVHQARVRTYLRRDLCPVLGHKPIADITAPELLVCLRRIESGTNRRAGGKPCTETANRVRSLMSALWRYAIATGRCERDIAADLKGSLTRHVERNFAHITDPQLLGKLLRDIDTYRGTPAVLAALRMLPIVFTRPGELRLARWADIDFDAAEWRYTVSKTGMPHIVPLAPQVLTILRDLQPLTGAGEFVFAANRGKPISEATIGGALKTLGYGSDVIQPHGFRHTAATALAEMGWSADKIDKQLSHLVPGVKGVYQKSVYLEDRRAMMLAWADYLDALKAGAVVMPINRAAG